MALGQESTPFESSRSQEDGGGLALSEASAPRTDAFDPTADTVGTPAEETTSEPPRPSRRRRRADRTSASVQTKLAGAVAKLSKIEEAIASHMVAAEQLVQRLETRGDHKVAGYSSRADFEQRLLASTPIIHAMRLSVAAAEPRKQPRAVRRRARVDARTRRTQALESVAQALVRLRSIDLAIHRAALSARDTLGAIESERLFDECGYPSFEEFLERALGPSPLLAAAIALAEREPAPAPEPELVDESEVEDVPAESHFDEPPGFSSNFMNEAAPEAPSHAEANIAPPSLPAAAAPAPSKFSPKQLVVSVALCVAATFAGGAGGSWSAIGALARTETAATTAEAAPSAEPASARPSTPAHPAASARAAVPVAKELHVPQATRTVEVDPLSIPVKAHARPTGPREARR